MKCDELQYEKLGDMMPFYPRSTLVIRKQFVNAAIAELKAENDRLSNALDKEHSETIKYMDELCNAKNEIERLTIDKRNAELRADVADATVKKLKAENERLKEKLEDVQATVYAESVDAGMEDRSLKRALWLARGYIMTLLKRDFQRLAYQCNNDNYKTNLLRRRNRYFDLSEKFLKKAEEYK